MNSPQGWRNAELCRRTLTGCVLCVDANAALLIAGCRLPPKWAVFVVKPSIVLSDRERRAFNLITGCGEPKRRAAGVKRQAFTHTARTEVA